MPLTIEEITPEWLTQALRTRAPEAGVESVEVVDVMHSTTTKVRLRLGLDAGGRRAGLPEVVILKGGFEPHSRNVEMTNMHEKEVRGYRDVFPAMPLPTPACYFADYDRERRQGIIIMEDLVGRGVTFCHASRPQTPDQVARRLTALARFHAKSWGSAEVRPGGRWAYLDDFLESMQPFFDHNIAPQTWGRFCAAPRGAAVSVRFHDRAWMADAHARMVRFSQTLPHCVLHGDTHLGNLYVDPDGTPGFFDTLASRGPGMMEVTYHVSAALDAADRRDAERPLVQHYLDELAHHGVEAPPIEEAMRQYGVLLLYGYFIWMTTESHYQTESVNTANAARVGAAMLDHDTIGLIRELP
jgi:hypothetical protein